MLDKYIKNPKELAVDIKNMVLAGEVNPLMAKVLHDIFNEVMKDKDVKDAIMNEADLHGGEIEFNGFKYKKSARTTHSYKHDGVWQELAGKVKAREELMKLAHKQDVADPNTGEIISPSMISTSEFLRKA
jgi:hypothetical protein